ncbi:glutamate ABC transporter substrate-binding protein [Bailinhaonella thermotolerans]|nr:glutamate ABC transporter substrate-binding protein [Bailinhaonella thermotolerans]
MRRVLIVPPPAAALAVLAALALLAGCGGDRESAAGRDTLVIGVNADGPGLGLRTGNRFEGFDVDVAREIARRLGARDVRFRALRSADREKFLERGTVDLVVATYSITAERKTRVTFAGPYYVAHQDTLVRRGEGRIRDVRDLAGRRLCRVDGSNSWRRVIQQRGVPAEPVPAGNYAECVRMLKAGLVDAVSTDDLILAGLVRGDSSARVVNAPFSDERYGVGLRKGDVAGCEAVNKAITGMYQDGTAAGLLRRWFGPSGLRLTTTVPEFEGCD